MRPALRTVVGSVAVSTFVVAARPSSATVRVSNRPPIGRLDTVNLVIAGWALDPDQVAP